MLVMFSHPGALSERASLHFVFAGANRSVSWHGLHLLGQFGDRCFGRLGIVSCGDGIDGYWLCLGHHISGVCWSVLFDAAL